MRTRALAGATLMLAGEDYLPGDSFLNWRGPAELIPAAPEAVIWSR
jgi:hypothetical protein